MREIYKRLTLPIDGKPYEFRLRKLDAFSGAQLLQLFRKYLPAQTGGQKIADLIGPIFLALTAQELRELMTMCLSSTDVLLDAGWQPILQQGEWSWPELEYDTAGTVKITLESVLWSLDSFFIGVGSSSRPAADQET